MIAFDYSTETPRRWWEILVAASIAALTFLLLTLWSYPMLHPGVWDEVAIAAGLRAPTSPLNGLYRSIVSGLFAGLPASTVLRLLPILGRAVVACCAAGVYLTFVEVFPSTLRLNAHMGRLGGHIARLVAVLAAVLFLGADPIWRAAQTFSPTTLFIAEIVLVWALFFRFVRRGVLWPLYISSAILGSMTAETPLGILFSIVVVVSLLKAVAYALNPDVPFVNPLVDSLVRAVTFKRLCNIWITFLALQLGGDFWNFKVLGGLGAAGCEAASDYPVVYLKAVIQLVKGAASPVGWLFAALMCVTPFVLAIRLLPKAWDEDRFLPYAVGLLFAIIGLVSLGQVTGFRSFWFWLWIRETPMISSDLLLSALLILNVAACAFSLAVFGIDAVCRNYARIAKQVYPESMGIAQTTQLMESISRNRVMRRRAFFLTLLVVPAVVLWGRRQPQVRDMMQVISDYSDEVLAELGENRNVLFTDGSFDTWLELRALAAGRTLWTLSLMALNTPAEVETRLRAAENEEDKALLTSGAVTTLRSWLAAKSPRLEKVGVQVGFELWRREGTVPPPLSGLMALPGRELPEGESARARMACEGLIKTIHALDEAYTLPACPDAIVRRLFPFVLWRLSRLAVMRGKVHDRAGRRAEAFEAAAEADELDAVNYSLARLYRDSKWLSRQSTGTLMPTPREGLVIGLARADFTLASQFAQPILRSDPDDPRANFAVGMKHYLDEQYARAEYHLVRCLKRRPNEPAVLNNLAMAQLKLDKLDDAEANARKALSIIPTSQEIQRTLNSVLAARKAKTDK